MLHTTPYQLAAAPPAKPRVVAFLKGAMENGSSETICAWLELAVCRSDILSQLSTAWTVDIVTVWCILDLVYDRNRYFGLGLIPKPKLKLADTFG